MLVARRWWSRIDERGTPPRAASAAAGASLDADVLVVDKPAGVPMRSVHGAYVSTPSSPTSGSISRTPMTVHRLDRDTTGCRYLRGPARRRGRSRGTSRTEPESPARSGRSTKTTSPESLGDVRRGTGRWTRYIDPASRGIDRRGARHHARNSVTSNRARCQAAGDGLRGHPRASPDVLAPTAAGRSAVPLSFPARAGSTS